MATSSPSGYVPNVHHPEIMRSILAGIVETGDVLRARLVINGTTPTSTTVTAKVWRASSPEPAPWLLTATDSTAAIQSPGGVGVLIYVSGSWTGTAPVLSIDNLRVAPLV